MADVVVHVPDSVESFVQQQLASGQFASASDYIVSLIAEAQRQAALERVDQLLIAGLDSGKGEEATPAWWAAKKPQWTSGGNQGASP